MRQDRDDPEAHRRQLALFRFAIISDLDIETLPRGERSARLVELATRTYRAPDGHDRQFPASARSGPGGARTATTASTACCPTPAPHKH